jgi:catechol 2,3-dioxygenase-like lactoylglutathione lyase family enzyme
MIDHVGIKVESYEQSLRFFREALKPLGYVLAADFGTAAGFGTPGRAEFWISAGPVLGPTHLAFSAESRAAVDAFHKAALAAGARDNGPPGIRTEYHEHYYGAFVLDLDGNNVEAVCHKAE